MRPKGDLSVVESLQLVTEKSLPTLPHKPGAGATPRGEAPAGKRWLLVWEALPLPGSHKEAGQLPPGAGAGADGQGSPVPGPELEGLRARPAVYDWSPGFFQTPGRMLNSVGLTRT